MKGKEFNKNMGREHERGRLKTSPASPLPMQKDHKATNQETIMIFGFEQYPFPNQENNQSPLLKTIVNLDLSTQKLEKVIKLAHPNLIGLRKIVRSSPREVYHGSKHRSYYSFYYETVSYSLRDLVEDPQKNVRIVNQLRGIDLKQLIMDLTQYLRQAGIFYVCRLQDIGVNRDGSIKVYIPPNTVFESSYNPNVHQAILALAEWWENAQNQLGLNKFKKDKKIIQLQPPRLSDNGDLEMDDPTMRSSTLERELGELLGDEEDQEIEEQNAAQLKQSNKSCTSQLIKLGSVQMEKFKKIDEQVKFIRLRMNEKTKRNPNEEARQVGKSKSSINLFQSQQTSKRDQIAHQRPDKPQANYFPREPIQQNIHTINIYNHNPPHVTPFPIPSHNYMQKSKHYPPPYYEPNLDPEFFRDQEEEYSQDTYDIQFQNQFDVPMTPSNGFRHTLLAQDRDLSEYSEHCHKKSKEAWTSDMKKQKQVMQMCNKNVTESAGPLQFKSFVNKIIKPQFLAKKSNIYEDPGEDGEEQSQRQATRAKEREESKRLNSSSNLRQHCSTDKGLGEIKKIFNKSVAEFAGDQITRHEIKRINSQNDFTIRSKISNDGQIEEKVRRALEKTKNAIALLNKVKSKGSLKNPNSQQS